MSEKVATTEHYKRRKSLAVLATGIASLALSGCIGSGSNQVVAEACKAISDDTGRYITPQSYPLGKITYEWDPVNPTLNLENNSLQEWAWNNDSTDKGRIITKNGHYLLVASALTPQASGLNSLATNGSFNKLGVNAAVAILNTEIGDIGFTTGCLSTSVIDGVKTRVVELPTR